MDYVAGLSTTSVYDFRPMLQLTLFFSIADRSGVVIARCKGCESQHVIADNLGWTDYKGGFQKGETNIEDYFANRGMADNVSRVSTDVFNLEKALSHDTKSGSIIGDDGNPALE
jgi:hypothetical protein